MLFMSAMVFSAVLLHAIGGEIVRQSKRVMLDGKLVMRANFAIIYSFCPICIFIFPDIYKNNVDLFNLYADESLVLYISLIVAVSYISAIVSYNSFYGRRPASASKDEQTYLDSENTLMIVCVMMLAIGVASFFVYTQQYGGYSRTVEVTGIIRQNLQDQVLETEGSLIFVQNFTIAAFLASTISLVLGIRTKRIVWVALFLASFVVSVLVTTIWGSRGHVIIFALMMIFGAVYALRPSGFNLGFFPFFVGAVIIFAIDFFVGIGKEVLNWSASGVISVDEVLANYKYVPFGPIIGYYDEYIASLVAAAGQLNPEYSYFYDSIIAPVYLVPSRLFGFEKPETIVTLNTYLVAGIWTPMTPPGLAGYGYYSFGMLGVIVSSAIYGAFLGYLDGMKSAHGVADAKFSVIYIPVMLYWAIYFFQGDPKNLILTLFPACIMIALLRMSALLGKGQAPRRALK